MSAMLATIDEKTAQKLARDRARYGQAFMRLNADGSIDRLDAEQFAKLLENSDPLYAMVRE